MTSYVVSSWGNVIHAEHSIHELTSRYDALPTLLLDATILPYGNGRSYGDSCLNRGGALLRTRSLDRFIRFDRQTGVLACEAGVLLADILALVVPHGWFLPVVPGTSLVTVGGAIANDVHGKNHHLAGTFGCHVHRFELLRSDGTRLLCSPEQHAEWFCATVGGLGLTGVITWAELQLRRIPGPGMRRETIRFANLEEFFELDRESERDFEYTVAWIDCLGRGRRLGRGLLQRANHADEGEGANAGANAGARPDRAAGPPDSMSPDARDGFPGTRPWSVPFTPPVSLVNSWSLRVFNTIHYHRQLSKRAMAVDDFRTFFFPLDSLRNWNRLYGPRGFFQYQCVLPSVAEEESTADLLEAIARRGMGSFLAVLKRFGPFGSPGMLSFPREGTTLALDFPNVGAPLERLFEELDSIVAAAGGRLYPAKDGRMPGVLFRKGYPRLEEYAPYVDPAFSSSFWRRVTVSG